jgi:galactokinase
MISAALDAGALGAKINGSGGGGCMFAYAPENPDAVVAAIEDAGGKAYIIRVDVGTQEEKASLFY